MIVLMKAKLGLHVFFFLRHKRKLPVFLKTSD